MRKFFLTVIMALLACGSQAQVNITLNSSKKGAEIPSTLYGIFFEEIKFAGCGGLYAELVRNRSFEDDHNENLWWWDPYNGASLELVTTDATHSNMINDVQEHAVKVTATSNLSGIRNQGYWGMNIAKGKQYKLSFWAKGDEGTVLNARLLGSNSQIIGKVQLTETLTGEWKRYTATIKATSSDGRGTLAILSSQPATFYLDVVSLFPPTFKDRPNGMRIDLAQMTADLKPAFMRFPGGCVIEGNYDAWTGKTCRMEWKKQLGPIENRLGHRNNNWGYCVDDGMGVFEYFQFSEDIGAEPLFVANLGMGHGWHNDYLHNEEYIQEALDLIEFANGDVTTTYGKIRAEMGHPEPFNLKYMELGNEANAGSGNLDDAVNHYGERYYQFYKAIKAKYPYMVLIGDGDWNGEGWGYSYPVDIVDAHHYNWPEFFMNSMKRYDNRDRKLPPLYIGEYAVTEDFGAVGNLRAALGEAVFMMGLERNGDVVSMASYAPMFSNDDSGWGWPTEMMHYNAYKSFGTPSYYIQKLFPNHLGTTNIEVGNTAVVDMPHTIGVGSWNTAFTATGLKVTDNQTGKDLLAASYLKDGANWKTMGNQWQIGGGTMTQGNDTDINQRATARKAFTSNHYTYELTMTKTSGSEGFIIPFYYVDGNNYCWMNIGGWNNTAIGLEQNIQSNSSVVGGTIPYNIETGTPYKIKIVVDSLKVSLSINGSEVMKRTIKRQSYPALYTVANKNAAGDTINLRIVNPHDYAQEAVIKLRSGYVAAVGGEYIGGVSGDTENNYDTPKRVYPRNITKAEFEGREIRYTVPRNSANFVTITVSSAPVSVQAPEADTQDGKGNGQTYTLQGVPVDSPTQRGIYISNGRKILKQ